MNKLLCGTAALGLIALSAEAAPVVWHFDSPLGDLGPTHVFSDGIAGDPMITAMAFGPGRPHLTAKNDGPDEAGLGLTNSPADGEITPGSWVQFDISKLAGVTGLDLGFAANSTVGGDIWHVYGSKVSGALGTSILAGTGGAIVDLMGVVGAWPFLNATADLTPTGNGTILAAELTADIERIPEPASLMLLASGMFALAWINRRRIKSAD